MRYKGYYGTMMFHGEDQVWCGKVDKIDALVSYESKNMIDLQKAFERAVDDYLEQKEQNNEV